MNLRSSAGWRRLGLSVALVLGPVILGTFAFALVNVNAFMRSSWALWTLIASVFTIYSIGYVADIIRRREAGTGLSPTGDGSPLVVANADSQRIVLTAQPHVRTTTWVVASIWAGTLVVLLYAAFRFWWMLANGVALDWTLVVAGALLICFAAVLPSIVGWRRFRLAVAGLADAGHAWPTFRTDQFADSLHQLRPGAVIPQDLLLLVSDSRISVWTTERVPRLLISLPRSAPTTLAAVELADRLGSLGMRIGYRANGEIWTFDLVLRRRGALTYFRPSSRDAEEFARVV